MFRCKDCGCEFEELARWEEERGEYWGVSCNETMYGCPECYSTSIEEVDEEDD